MKDLFIKNKGIVAVGLGLVSIIFTVFAVLAINANKLPTKNNESTTKQTHSNIFVDNETIIEEKTTYYEDEITTIPDVTKPSNPPSYEEETSGDPIVAIEYMIKVNKTLNCITIYTKDEIGAFTVPYKSMTCSVGPEVKTGTYAVTQQYLWYTNVSYVSRLKGTLVISSCEYNTKGDFSTLKTDKFNQLGETQIQDGITLCVADAKWIYDNCINETPVVIYENANTVGPLGKPELIKIPATAAFAGWDPTDPNEENGWLTCNPVILGPIKLELAIDSIKTFVTKDDILANYEVMDTCGNDITKQLVINIEDLSIVAGMDELGEYVIHLEVTDSLGRFVSKEVTVIVIDGETTTEGETCESETETGTDETGTDETETETSTDETDTDETETETGTDETSTDETTNS